MGPHKAVVAVRLGVAFAVLLALAPADPTPVPVLTTPQRTSAAGSVWTEPLAAFGAASTASAKYITRLLRSVGPRPSVAFAQTSTGGIPLQTGWQLVSVPVVPSSTSPATVLASISGQLEGAQAFDGCSSTPTHIFDPTASAGNTLTSIDPSIGLWIKMTAPGTLNVSGSAPTSTSMHLCPGLNLVGYPLATELPVTTVLASIAGKFSRVYGFNIARPQDPWEIYDVSVPDFANTLQTMKPGRGYYILATADTTLTLAATALPTGNFTGLTDGVAVTQRTAITGTVTSSILASWQLQYRLQDEPTFTTFATGATSTVSGTFDPTLLLNGLYDVRLVATDLSGQTTATSSVSGVVVEGHQKVGDFSLSFNDLKLPLDGLPMQVVRRYDSRDKRADDFGVGWTMGLGGIHLQVNGTLGTSFVGTSTGGFFPQYCVELAHPVVVAITFADDTVDQFAPSVTPHCQSALLGPPQVVNLTFQRIAGTGTTGSLDQLDAGDLLVAGQFPGPLQLLDVNSDGVVPVDPQTYAYTTRTGQVLTIGRHAGLQSIANPDGHSVTITSNGLIASDGENIPFTRDSQGRISSMVDPAGHAFTYSYDASGNLSSVVDQVGNVTAFTYDSSHYLVDILDPRGVHAIRTTYDANGRVSSLTDASGNAINLNHGLAANTETVTDRLGNPTTYVYDAQGNVLQAIDPLGHTTTYTYDAENNKLSETDALGHTTTYTYDANNNRLSETDPLGNRTTFTYNNFGEPLTVIDALGHSTSATYDANGHVLTATDALGNVTHEAHDGHGNKLSLTDPLGNATSYSYDNHGNAISTTDGIGNVVVRSFDPNHNRLSETTTRSVNGSAQSVTATSAYDGRNRLVQVTNPEGGTLRRTYTPNGLVGSVIDPLGHVTAFAYDTGGRLTTTTYADNTTATLQYDADGHKTASTDKAGQTTTYSYDAAGRLIRTTYPDGTTESTAYDAANHVIARTSGNGKTTTYAYDAGGHMTTMRDPLGGTTTYTYDGVGRKSSETDPNAHSTSFVYDADGHFLQTVHPDGTSQRKAYDAAGNYVSSTDEAGDTTGYAYDAMSRLIKVSDPLGSAYHFTYDPLGNRISQTDPQGNVTAFGYDRVGRVTSQTLPLGQTQTSVYDSAGNRTIQTDYNGTTTNATFDALNHLTGLALSDGSTVALTYTSTDLVKTVVDTRGTTTFTYDQRDRPTLVENPDGSQISYTYDADGNRTSVTTPGGATAYTYDANDRLAAVTDPHGAHSSLSYDAAGNRTGFAYANDITATYTYDPLNRLTGLSQTLGPNTLHSYTYTLGPTGNRTRAVENTGRTVNYSYNAALQLTGESIDDPTAGASSTSYAYDAAGNRISQSGPGGTINYAFDANSRLLSAGSTTFTYDNNGNTLSQTAPGATSTYQYDDLNRLVKATTPDGVTSYLYDPGGNRVQTRSPSGTTNYLVDPFGAYGLSQVLRETDSTGASVVDYVYADGDLLSLTRAAGTAFRLGDGQRSTRELTDASGNVTDSYTYDAFGNLLGRTGSTPNTFLYTGQQFDANLGAYNLRARYYAPTTRRFLTADRLPGSPNSPKSLHRYAYAANDPVNRWDPTGRVDIDVSEIALEVEIEIEIDSQMAAVDLEEGAAVIEELAFAETEIAEGQLVLAEETAVDFSLDEAEVEWVAEEGEFELPDAEQQAADIENAARIEAAAPSVSAGQAQALEEVVSEADAIRVALARAGIGAIGSLTPAGEAIELLKALEALFGSFI